MQWSFGPMIPALPPLAKSVHITIRTLIAFRSPVYRGCNVGECPKVCVVRFSPLNGALRPLMLIETARGCWWGAKNHCTFCGLNGETMGFRAKSADRVMTEIE